MKGYTSHPSALQTLQAYINSQHSGGSFADTQALYVTRYYLACAFFTLSLSAIVVIGSLGFAKFWHT